jgi:outer membrane protein assembly factor BamB
MHKRTLPVVGLLALAAAALAADWPQFRGPERDDVSRETGLLKEWPADGPRLLWTSEEAGIGYSGPAVVGNVLYTLGADEEHDYALAFDVRTGKKLWSTPVGPFVKNTYGSGPRSTPTIDGDRLYVLGAAGQLACLKAADGSRVWSVELVGDLGGGKPFWNYSESPLVDGDRVICTPGGAKGAVAALDKATGKVLWRCKELTDPAGYSSCVLDETGGLRHYVQQTMKGTAGVSARDGALVWYQPNKRYQTAVIPTPIVYENYVYAVAGYGAGASLLQLTRDGDRFNVRNLYDDEARRAMDNKHGGVVRVGEHVYGWSDSGDRWVCQELKTGKVTWSSKALGRGSVTCAGGSLYLYSEDDGTAVLVPASPEGWSEKGRFTIPRQTSRREFQNNHWTHPVVANGRLYLRDQELLFCYDVKAGRP